ncbi:MAG TPA: hypothetical protein VKD71_12730 [Gemmataceae bacterium]|nr:hypothetical protein [Gemmataceae bacterium]
MASMQTMRRRIAGDMVCVRRVERETTAEKFYGAMVAPERVAGGDYADWN